MFVTQGRPVQEGLHGGLDIAGVGLAPVPEGLIQGEFVAALVPRPLLPLLPPEAQVLRVLQGAGSTAVLLLAQAQESPPLPLQTGFLPKVL